MKTRRNRAIAWSKQGRKRKGVKVDKEVAKEKKDIDKYVKASFLDLKADVSKAFNRMRKVVISAIKKYNLNKTNEVANND